MTAPGWLTAQPIAHRGLHDRAAGRIENSPGAALAAVERGFAIECDVQLSADGEAMVFHDNALDRLTEAAGLVRDRTAAELKRLTFKATADRMMTLGELLDLVGGRSPLVLELKSHFDGDIAIAMRTAALLRGRTGPIAAMSFDPRLVATIGWRTPEVLRGLGARRPRKSPRVATERTGAAQGRSPTFVLQAMRARPHFIACRQQDLATAPALIARHLLRLPFLAWTVRSEQERRKALRHADQVIFEGFRPQVQPR